MSRVDSVLTMSALVDKLLLTRSPLVIGYSGWEGDVFMTALKRRLVSSLPFNLYWFCYRHNEIERLPEFLNHPDVYFVVPPDISNDESGSSSLPESGDHSSATSNETNSNVPSLSATVVLDLLLNQTGTETPHLTRDPLSFFAESLRKNLPAEDTDDGHDIYSLRSVLDRVERAKEREEQALQAEQANETILERVREAVRAAKYDDACAQAKSITLHELNVTQLRELMNAMDAAGRGLGDKSQTTTFTCDLAMQCFDELAKKGEPTAPKVFIDLANLKGNVAFAIKQYKDACAAYDVAITRFADNKAPGTQGTLAFPRNNKGLALRNLGDNEAAIRAHDEVLESLKGSEVNDEMNSIAIANAFKGTSLSNLQRYGDAAKAFEDMKDVFQKVKEPTEYAKSTIANAASVEAQVRASLAGSQGEKSTPA